MEIERYPSLVVHGPLQASLLAEFAAELRDGVPPRRFSFRGLAPLFNGQDFTLCATLEGNECQLRIADKTGLISSDILKTALCKVSDYEFEPNCLFEHKFISALWASTPKSRRSASGPNSVIANFYLCETNASL